MINRSQAIRKIAERLPDLLPIKGGYFVRRQFEHILSGYSLEYAPSGAWIWRVVYPLFDRSDDGMHLTYSHRLTGLLGHISSLEFSREQMIDEFASRVSEFDKTAIPMHSIGDFCQYCEKDAGIVRNKHTALGLGYAFALAGNRDKSVSYLEYSIPKLDSPHRAEAKKILNLLSSDPEHARGTILLFEQEMRLMLRLPP
jgi:hypothetical protein